LAAAVWQIKVISNFPVYGFKETGTKRHGCSHTSPADVVIDCTYVSTGYKTHIIFELCVHETLYNFVISGGWLRKLQFTSISHEWTSAAHCLVSAQYLVIQA